MIGHVKAAPNSTHSPNAAERRGTPPWKRKPVAKPSTTVIERAPGDEHGVGQRPSEQRRRARDGQRPQPVEQAALDVVGHADGAAGEQSRADGHGRDEAVGVGDAAGPMAPPNT